MKKMVPALLIIVLSILGMADASYLTYEKLSGIIPPCGTGFNCNDVLSSPYSQIGPVPLSALGFLFYLTVFIVAVAYYLEFDLLGFFVKKLGLPKPFHLEHTLALALLGSLGAAFSVYLVGLMAFVIEAWCLYCLLSAATSMSIFVVSLVLWKQERQT